MVNRVLRQRRGETHAGCLVVLFLILAVAAGLYVTRARWTPRFKSVFGEKSAPVGDPDMTVYVEAEGYVYHRAGCNLLKHDVREMTLEQARKSGYKPCTKCNPPQ